MTTVGIRLVEGLIARGIDTVAIDESWQRAGILIGAILVSGALAWVFNFFRQWNTARTVGDVVLELRQAAFVAVMARDMSFYDEYPTGKIVSRVTSDTQAFSQVVALSTELLSQVLLVVLLIGYLFSVNARLTLVLLAVAPVVVGVALGFRTIARRTVTQRSAERPTPVGRAGLGLHRPGHRVHGLRDQQAGDPGTQLLRDQVPGPDDRGGLRQPRRSTGRKAIRAGC